MANKCDFLIAQDIAGDCSNPAVAGVRNTGYIINYDDIDWDSVERDADNPNLIHVLPLKDGKHAYRMYIPGSTPFSGTNKTFVAGTFRNKFTKHLNIVVLDNGAEVSHSIIDQLANGQFVAVIENKYSGHSSDNTFEVYGFEQGLSATEMSDDKYSEETDGGWSVALEEQNAPSSGIFLLVEGDNAVSNTRTLLEGLVA